MTLRALQNPVRSARIVKHGGDTLTLEIESDRGRYRWDVKPVYRSQAEKVRSDFSRDWRSALKGLISQSIGVYPTKLNEGRSLWKWKKDSFYLRTYYGDHPNFRATLDGSEYGGRLYRWSIQRKGYGEIVSEGHEESAREAQQAVEKWRGGKFLFNEKSKWKNLGAGEYGRSFHGFHLRVIYGRVFQRYNWSIYWHGGTSAVATGHSDSFPDAQKAAEQAALSRRTLFNDGGWRDRGSMGHQREFSEKVFAVVAKLRKPQRGWTWHLFTSRAGVTDAGWGRTAASAKKQAERSNRKRSFKHPRTLFNPRLGPVMWWVGEKGDRTLDLRKGRQPLLEFPWLRAAGPFGTKNDAVKFLRRQEYMRKKPRVLFNPTQEMRRHGKIVIERVKIPRDEALRLHRTYGWGWNVYITMGFMLQTPGDERLYGPVASGLNLSRSKAVADSRKAYSTIERNLPREFHERRRREAKKKPRMLFNAVRR